MKLFLDDERNPPDDTWIVVSTVEDAKSLIQSGKVISLSFDHDLGTAQTGYDLACWIEEQAFNQNFDLVPSTMLVHSQNPVGASKIRQVIERIKNWQNRK